MINVAWVKHDKPANKTEMVVQISLESSTIWRSALHKILCHPNEFDHKHDKTCVININDISLMFVTVVMKCHAVFLMSEFQTMSASHYK